jgi:hypothetical protein
MKTAALEAILRDVLRFTLPAAGLTAAGLTAACGQTYGGGCAQTPHRVLITPDAGTPDGGEGGGDAGGGGATAEATTGEGATADGPSPDCEAACRGAVSGMLTSCAKLKDGSGAIECIYVHTCAGRRPAGYALRSAPDGVTMNRERSCRSFNVQRPAADQGDGVGRFFAAAAALEAASVDAFLILRAELTAHGAPRRLLRAAERSARDEIRHARMMGALARRHGANVEAPVIEGRPVRSLEAIAIENAVEGCVRETYGALVATYQAEASRDPHVRAVMRRVARDETRHAALGWEIARWASRRLDREARARVVSAQRAAVIELTEEAREEAPKAVIDQAGLPSAARARAMIDELRQTLWT